MATHPFNGYNLNTPPDVI